MNNTLEACLSQALQKKQKIAVPGFGEFSLQASGAAILDKKKIVPPGNIVVFRQNFQQENPAFIVEIKEFVQNTEPNSTENQLYKWAEDRIHYWKNMLLSGTVLKLEGLGVFTPSHGEWVFNGERIQKISPAYFGLEDIHIDSHKAAYRDPFTRWLLYTFLFIVPIVGLAALIISQNDRIFGKKKLDDLQVISATHRIQDSATIQQKSITDSLHKSK